MFALPGRGLSPEWDSIGADLTSSRIKLTLSRMEAAFYLTSSRMEPLPKLTENGPLLNFAHKSKEIKFDCELMSL